MEPRGRGWARLPLGGYVGAAEAFPGDVWAVLRRAAGVGAMLAAIYNAREVVGGEIGGRRDFRDRMVDEVGW